MSITLPILFIVLGYLLGAVPTGLWVARARGIDIRRMGSGNIGATNVLRSMGVGPAVLVVLADPVKGALAAAVPLLAGQPDWAVAAAGFAAVLGNDFNVFLGFRGGKGIATTTGVFLVVNPPVAAVGLILGLITIALGRLVSLGSMVAVIVVPLILIFTGDYPVTDLVLSLGLMTVATFQHRENLRRLAKGSERRLGEKAGPR